jgi:hypothetical protein
MKSLPLIYILTTLTLFASYYDSDIDGVEDRLDQCSHTPFDELVDEFGCSQNANQGSWTLKVGTELGFDTLDKKSTSYSFSIDYIVNRWSAGISNTNYTGYNENNTTTRETGDIYTYIGYEIQNEAFSTLLALGAKIATADESIGTGENDYYISTQLENFSIERYIKFFTTWVYTFTGDTQETVYKDIFSYNIGLGYYVNESYYTSIYYENSQSIYEETENYQALVWANRYSYNDTYFVEFDYTRGLDTFSYDHLFSFKIGVTFE